MPQIDPNAAFVGTALVACVVTVALRRLPALAFMAVVAVTVLGWGLQVLAVDAAVPRVMEQMRRDSIAKGVPLTVDEQLYDGTGDRVGIMCGGWFPGVAGALVGVGVCAVLRRVKRNGGPAAA